MLQLNRFHEDQFIQHKWAMPNKWTFLIEPIAELLNEECKTGIWVDPFCGRHSPARRIGSITNDINENMPATFHMDALEFLKLQPDNHFDGALYDPPYSLRQASECYKELGLKPNPAMFKSSWQMMVKEEISRIVKSGGKAICFGWNSTGIGDIRGFRYKEHGGIFLINHGASHNDTIVTVEIKK